MRRNLAYAGPWFGVPGRIGAVGKNENLLC